MDSATSTQSSPLFSQPSEPSAPLGVYGEQQHPTAFGHSVSHLPPPYTASQADNQAKKSSDSPHTSGPSASSLNAPAPSEPPPPYQSVDQHKGETARTAGSSLCMRCITKATGAALMTLAGIGGFLLTVALSPLVGLYMLGQCCANGGFVWCSFDKESGQIMLALLLATVALAALPVIICSPIAGMDCAFRAGRSYFGREEFHAPRILTWSHEFMNDAWRGFTAKKTEPPPAVIVVREPVVRHIHEHHEHHEHHDEHHEQHHEHHEHASTAAT